MLQAAPSPMSYNVYVEVSRPDPGSSAQLHPPTPSVGDADLHLNGRVTHPLAAPAVETGLKHFLFTHKGGVTLTFSALVYVVAWAMLRFTTWHNSGELIATISEAALIGGLCDYIALRMIFERKWYLPGSGVLPRNRVKLIDGIANTIEKEWLTPQMIGERLRAGRRLHATGL